MRDGSAIAVVGMSCRVPGGADPAAFWRLLRAGSSTISEIPADRRPADEAAMALPPAARFGGFLEHVDRFDCSFFGISPKEAAAMDPQQRLMLELCWEAFEDAGAPPGALTSTQTGVFVGAISSDYADLLHELGADAVTRHVATGLNRGMIANRVSHALGLRGPSLTIDTGQSSSLVAVHLACESVRRGESTLALACGVHLNISAANLLQAARFGGLSPDGRCFTFDARANGYVRGEGGGVVVLKRLSDALAAGDSIYCVIRSSAVNNDGGGAMLTAPSQPAQEEVLRLAYRRAGVKRAQVQYVELHGTGTVLGDRVEATALGAVLGSARPADRPLPVGSVKTNLGHLEAAAGIVGLLKTALCIKHGEIPASLNFQQPRPDVPLQELGLLVQQELVAWPSLESGRLAGVSSFGLGGTNCHVVLGEAPSPNRQAFKGPRSRRRGGPLGESIVAWPISGRSEPALRAQARKLAEHIDANPDLELDGIGSTLATGRTAFEHRAVVLGAKREELLDGLRSLAAGQSTASVVHGVLSGAEPRPVFVFPGQGSQWQGMALELIDASPVFAERIQACSDALSPHVDWSLHDVLRGSPDAPGLDRIDVVQPLLFCVMVSLAELWRACGVRAAAVIGHSQGEIAAAHVAGAISLAEAARIVAVRSKVLTTAAGQGGMASVALPAKEIESRIARWKGRVSVAAVNGPSSLVVSGETDALSELLEECVAAGARVRKISAAYGAGHSIQVEVVRDLLIDSLDGVEPRPGELSFYSTVTAGVLAHTQMDAHYWYRNARETVRFEETVRALLDDGYSGFLEVSAHPVLTAALQDTVDRALGEENDALVAYSLKREEGSPARFLRSLATLWVRGIDVDWEGVLAPAGQPVVGLPTYAFQRERHWLGSSRLVEPPGASTAVEDPVAESSVFAEGPAGDPDDSKHDSPRRGVGIEATSPASPPEQGSRGQLAGRLHGMSAASQESLVLGIVLTEAAAVLGYSSPEALPAERTFKELGFDSVGGVELRNRLNAATGLRLATALVFDHPTPRALAVHLVGLLTGSAAEVIAVRRSVEADEPIAIVSMACRYPGGVCSPEDLWDLVSSGVDAITELPANRGWPTEALYHPDPDHRGTSYTREGGFIHDVDEFDAEFFGISPREALAMDPQQRLQLEVCWEVLERAGLSPDSLRGSDTGVFTGVIYHDYGARVGGSAPPELEAYLGIGSAGSVASGRVAYTLGFEGPAITIDTACSASLVAMHLACGALRSHECALALAGGVTVLATPQSLIELSRQRTLAPDGRSKAYADTADGVGWSEGAGVLLLERLSDARRLGHRVLGLVRSSAVNQDGASNGLTAPNGPSQQRVIEQALANAGLSGGEVEVVEGHGTGTRLGDPIEIEALIATYGRDRAEDEPLWLGSIKSNIGHTQAAAGVAGVIKMVMAMHHGVLPRTLHIDRPSSQVDWSEGRLSLLREPKPWACRDRPRRAGVSSFGISGTNAHLILEEAPAGTDGSASQVDGLSRTDCVSWMLSAHSAQALSAQAQRLGAYIANDEEALVPDVARALARRAVHAHRAVVIGDAREQMLAGLGALSSRHGDGGAIGSIADGTVIEGIARGRGRVAFVFPGQGAQWSGMAVELIDRSPVFAKWMNACAEALAEYVDWSLDEVLRGAAGAPGLERIDVVQPALFAVMVSLAELWRACGVYPDAVVGHSQGEIAAVCVAGGLSMGDAARIVALRSQALSAIAGEGGMVSVALGEREVVRLLDDLGGELSLAAVNGPCSTVVSGGRDGLSGLLARCESEGLKAREIPVDYAAHSEHVERIHGALLDACASIEPRSGEIPFYSSVAGGLLDMAGLDADYWYRNMREPVRFEQAVRGMLEDRIDAFVEVSPHPVLVVGIQETIEAVAPAGEQSHAPAGPANPRAVMAIGALRREDGGPERFFRSLAEAWVHGVQIDWTAVLGSSGRELPELPTYPFQRRRYWLDAGAGGDLASVGQIPGEHPLLGAAVALGDGGWLFTGRLSLQTHRWLSDHAVMDRVVLPGAAFLELALHAGSWVGCERLRELTLEDPLVLDERSGIQIQVSIGAPDNAGLRSVRIYARQEDLADLAGGDPGSRDAWTRHASGLLTHGDAASRSPLDGRIAETVSRLSGVWPPEDAEPAGADGIYELLADSGLRCGPALQGLGAMWRRGEELLVEVALPEGEHEQADLLGLHPTLLEAALHAEVLASGRYEQVWLPFRWRDVDLHSKGARSLRVSVSARAEGEIGLIAVDESGALVASVGSLLRRTVTADEVRGVQTSRRSLFVVNWAPLTVSPGSPPEHWAVLGDEDSRLACLLIDEGASADRHADLASLAQEVKDGSRRPEIVLWERALAPSAQGLDRAVRESAHGALQLLQAWLAEEALADSHLVILTRGAVAALPGEDVPGLVDSATSGLVCSAQSEHPGRLLLLDIDDQDSSARLLSGAVAMAIAADEPRLAIRDGAVYAPRLARAEPGPAPVQTQADGTVLITGGIGQLGGLLARHLVVEHGTRDLVLVSRRGMRAPGAEDLQAELTALGARVQIATCDVSDRSQLEELLGSIPEDRPLTGVIHAAGVLDDAMLDMLSTEQLDRVLIPKVDAAVHLHELTRDLDLREFVLFSSAAATLGAAGQANYAAANAFLDGLAAHRRARGMAARSIAWGQWDRVDGMTRGMSGADAARMRRLGVQALSREQGLELYDAISLTSDSLAVPVRLDFVALHAQAKSGALPALLRELINVPARPGADGRGGSLVRRLARLDDRDRRTAMLELLNGRIAGVLGYSAGETIDPSRTFKELGFDSLLAIELRNRLSDMLQMRLPATLIFDHPTPEEMARYLLNRIAGDDTRTVGPSAHRSTQEPVAIVGMSCRFPGGVSSPRELWELVASGKDAISAFPTDRGWQEWQLQALQPDTGREAYVREGGFVYDAVEFDPAFFRISPSEALAMDPQQRLLLEACWQALEDAGVDPLSLKGSQTGVYAGFSVHDYLNSTYDTPADLEAYGLTGGLSSVISGRVAYTFGFEGPAVTVDTACSSSLVAIHLACQALRSSECSLALAGGVTVLATPRAFIEFSRQGGLARNGRCRSFSDNAEGAGMSEGVGVVVLERLSDAQRNGHPVLAVVRGSAINQDGASNGLTAPSGASQQKVILQALANAGLSSAQVDAVEAHGTGTRLGDPIEAQALLATYGQDRSPDRPLWLGSIKSNIGHTLAAAGVAGVIKMVMAMRHGVLPKTLHVDTPSQEVDWSQGSLSLLTEKYPWVNGEPRRAGVSSFGISGTNAHVILEHVEECEQRALAAGGAEAGGSDAGTGASGVASSAVPWVLSAKSEAALGAQACRLSECLSGEPSRRSRDIAFSLAGRSALEHRAVILGEDSERLLESLHELGATGLQGDGPAARVVRGVARASAGTAFLFTGQGAQRVGMGSELYLAFTVFRDAFDEACVQLDELLDCSLRALVFGDGEQADPSLPSLLDRTVFAQAGLFALERASFCLLESCGVRPDFLIGHSIGELTAAHVAGVFSLQDACRLVAARGKLMDGLHEGGAMVAVEASEREMLAEIAGLDGRVALAAINGPSSVVVSGDEDAVLELAAHWERRDRKTKRLRVSHAFHSHHMDPMLDEFSGVAGSVSYSPPAIPIVSNLTGRVAVEGELCSAVYWVHHARETVRFGDGLRWLGAQGLRTFLELGPDGILSAMAGECLCEGDQDDEPPVVAALLRNGRPESQTFFEALAQAWVGGLPVDWKSMAAHGGGRLVTLPTYAFQRERYWLDQGRRDATDVSAAGRLSMAHPLLANAVALAEDGWLFTGRLSLEEHPWLADHVVLGRVLLPGTAFLELALHVGERLGCELVRELILQAPLVLSEQGAVLLQVRVGEVDASGSRSVSIHSCPESASGLSVSDETEWVCHGVGSLAHLEHDVAGREGLLERFEDEAWPPDGAEPVEVEDLYDRLAERGLLYGPVFQGLNHAWRRGEQTFVEVALSDGELEQAGSYGLHPALMDAAVHAMAFDGSLGAGDVADGVLLPFSWNEVMLRTSGARALRVCLWPSGEDALSLVARDEHGRLVASVGSLATRPFSVKDVGARDGTLHDAMFRVDWVEPASDAPTSAPPRVLVTCAKAVSDELGSAGVECRAYADMEALAEAVDGEGESLHVVLLDMRPFDGNGGEADGRAERVNDAVKTALHRVLASLQEWLAEERLAESRLVVLTQGAVATGVREVVGDLPSGAVWGFVRSAQSENPDRLVLVDADGDDASWRALVHALALSEPQVALRRGAILVPRLTGMYASGVLASPRDGGAWRLDVEQQGTLDGLALLPSREAEAPLAPGEVRVRVRAAGLNFRDVLMALSMYPGETEIGSEGAGVVVEVGEEVRDLRPGDRVMGLLGGGIGTLAVVDSRLVVSIPKGWSFTQAASVPIAFSTAYYALVDLAGLKKGERLLVHSAAGGVGMAAVQLARHLGAEVFATASPGKWDALRATGVEDARMASSRTLDFREEFLAATDGCGMDVVLDCLAGEFVDASLALLPRGGRFIEMGKADVRDPDELAVHHPDVAYRAFDLIEAGPLRLHEILVELLRLFERGALGFSPVTTWNVRRAPQAFRYMSQGQHIGKNVLRLPARIDTQGTVLVTGGTGALGGMFARHLVAEHGVRRLLLMSRQGSRASAADKLLAELTQLGAHAKLVACDVSDREHLQEVLQAVSPEHPLDAVFHTAGIIDDGVIGSLTSERIDRVLAAKVDGAWNLHELTKDSDLSMFVLFSAAAGTLGSPGQASYAAANSFLDALASHRHEHGLAGTSIAWGLWSQASEMTEHLGRLDRERIAKLGVRALAREEGLALLDEALAVNEALVVSARLDMGALRARARTGELNPLLGGLVRVRPRARDVAASSLARLLAETAKDQREPLVLDLIRSEAARVLGHGATGAVKAQSSFKELGFDSLAGVELRNRLVTQAGVRLPATLIFDYPTPAVLARHLVDELAGKRSNTRPARAKVTDEEPVAIIGMACRYPGGASSPLRLWQLLCRGGDAISPFPADRGWEVLGPQATGYKSPGEDYRGEGGFLHDAAEFDASFFGISPREAVAMDPQQRLLLETCWETLEDAAVDSRSLQGSRTGVFVGVGGQDYHRTARGLPPGLGGFGITGGSTSVASGRIAYNFGLEGPAMTVDTACSSSLVALHLACQALRQDECSLALAGGVAVMSSLALFSEFAYQGGLASDARCKAFADSADGVGWGEGVGVLLLERLSDARRLGHDVLAVIRGSAVNQDGASNGMTAPNGPSQQRVIMQALANAGLSPGQVDAVDGHGTGTRLGDPIEAHALLATYGRERVGGSPLWLGSVKSNIGHTQAAAGVAGVIKMVMALRNGLLPRTLHVDEPSREVDWSAGAVALLTEEVPWPSCDDPRRAGVSSFGISGTNAHVIIEEAPRLGADPACDPGRPVDLGADARQLDARSGPSDGQSRVGLVREGVVPWIFSARDARGLGAQGERLLEWVERDDGMRPLDVALSLTHRSCFEHRAVVVGGEREALASAVGSLAGGESAAGLVGGVVPAGGCGDVAFVFPGQGSQWVGMAGELLACSAVFAESVAECAEALAPFTDWSLVDVLGGEGGSALLNRVDVVQPALFAVMVALARLWGACGVHPDAVVGHSQGEIAAVCVAGGLSMGDAARIVALRSQALTAISGEGGMVSVALGERELAEWLDDFEGELSLAAVNGPSSAVVSGGRDGLLGLLARCESEGVKAREIPVDYAAHSVHVERIREELLDACASIESRSGEVPFYSSVTGGLLDMATVDAEYWYRNLRETVRFERAMRTLLSDGCRTAIETSPHPVLVMGVQDTAEDSLAGQEPGDVSTAGEVGVVGSLRRGEGGARRFSISLAEAWVRGVEVDWRSLFDGSDARRVSLPTYPFQRERYWLEHQSSGDPASVGLSSGEHPLLGAVVPLADGHGWLFTGRISLASHPWLADHAVLGVVLMPGTALLELVLHAGQRVGCAVVRELVIEAPLVLEDGVGVQLQVVVSAAEEPGLRHVSVYSRPEPSNGEGRNQGEPDAGPVEWVRHAEGTLCAGGSNFSMKEAAADALKGAWPPEGCEPLPFEGLYDRLADIGLKYGPLFQGLRGVWRRGEDVLFAEVTLSADHGMDGEAFAIHPVLLDCALHATAAGDGETADFMGNDDVRLPFSWSGVQLHSGSRAGARCLRVVLSREGEGSISLSAVDESGASVITVGSLLSRSVSAEQLRAGRVGGTDSLYRVRWTPLAIQSERLQARDGELSVGGVRANGKPPSDGSSSMHGDGWALLASDENGRTLLTDSDVAVPADCAVFPDLASLRGAVEDGQETPPRVVFADSSGVEHHSLPLLPGAARMSAARGLALLQEWLEAECFAESLLVFVTRGAIAVGGGEDVDGLVDAPLWGLVRSAQAESGGRLGLLDMDEGHDCWDMLRTAVGLIRTGGEWQLAVRDGVVYAPRLVRGYGGALKPPVGESGWRVESGGAGTLEDLRIVALPESGGSLERGQVRVTMRAGGVNFHDVVTALGLVEMGGKWDAIGGDGAGVVLEVGPGVEDLAVGDRVMGLFDHAFGSEATTDRRFLVPIPHGWSFVQAAAVPTAFLTALYGLVDLAKVRRGERVLVHAATGGVGIAAGQLARWLGAEVLGTASPGKWGTLRTLGFDDEQIASSRDLEFRERFLLGTGGAGVDVVLNSLTGELLDASLDLVGEGGRFLEMGKTDIRDPEEVAARWPKAAYRAFDLIEAGADRTQSMLCELLDLFERGVLEHPPLRAWDVRRVPEALRFMAQARHVGKIVLTFPPSVSSAAADGTVLITGGTGALGRLVATHLAERQGVRNLLLVSRQGPEAPAASELRVELGELGVNVRIVACDVSDREQLEGLLDSIGGEHPLRAVVHAAGALDDGSIAELNAERLDSVMAVKVDAAWNLHELTREQELDAFVLFSSAAGVFGSPGQANYAAANVFLDALAAHRRAQGLPAVSMAWGLWEQETGLTGHLSELDLMRMRRSGVAQIGSEQGLELLDAAWTDADPLTVPVRLESNVLQARASTGELPAMLRGLVRSSAPVRTESGESGQFVELLRRAPLDERRRIVLRLVRGEIAAVLGHSTPDAIDTRRPLKDVGFDSLLAVELRNRLNTATNTHLPATLAFDYPTPEVMAGYILEQISAQAAEPVAGAGIDLDKLQLTLSAISAEEAQRIGIAARLKSILSRWESADGAIDAELTSEDDLDTASDDEIFELIDREFGVS